MKMKCVVICLLLLIPRCAGPGDEPEFQPRPITVYSHQSSTAMVISMGGDDPAQAGLNVMQGGGNALDAVLASAMTHIVKTIGVAVSFGGTMSLVYYDAASGQVHSLNAPFKIPIRETNPLTIPYRNSGRTALVPGFLGGVIAAHDRLGRMDRSGIFASAIDLAENGFVLPAWQADMIRENYPILSRLPGTSRVFTKPDGSLYEEGDLFTQPDLAETLRHVVRFGFGYIYRGDWASEFVTVVGNDGGYAGMDDMMSYEVSWNDAVHTPFHGHEIYSIGLPAPGGVGLVEAFNIIGCSDLATLQPYTDSAEGLYQMIKVVRVGPLYRNFPNAAMVAEAMFPGLDFSQQARLTMASARHTWSKILSGEWSEVELRASGRIASRRSPHTSAEIAVDAEGNVAALVHTINTAGWGQTGIFVGGISISDIGGHAQHAMQFEGPGGYHHDDICPGMVLASGRPVLVFGSAGYGLHADSVQNVYNVLAYGDTPAESLSKHKVLHAAWWGDRPTIPQYILSGSFSDRLLDQVRDLGQPLIITNDPGQHWAGIAIDDSAAGSRLHGATTYGGLAGY